MNFDTDRWRSTGTPSDGPSDVVVLGAGIIGVTTAYAVARRGLTVALIDREPGPARRCSFANAAQLSYSYSDTLGSPALLRRIPQLLLGADPLFRIQCSWDPEFVGWGLRFLRNCSSRAQRRGTLRVLELALESRRALNALLQRHPMTFGHEVPGKMHLYFERGSLRSAEFLANLKARHGVVQHVLTADEARALEPALRGAPKLVGAVYSPHDEIGDAYLFATQLTDVLTSRYGVRTRFGLTAEDVAVDDAEVRVTCSHGESVRGRSLVIALGIGTPALLSRLRVHTPIQPLKGYSFTAVPGCDPPRISITDTARKLVFCTLMGRMRVAGGAELGNWNPSVDPGRLEWLVQQARISLPNAADFDHPEVRWADLRPMSPDSVPSIKLVRPRVVLNVGHGMLGWTLAMGAAERAASLAAGELERTSRVRS
jgi:D-amino-acid dehydrogenase